MNYNVFMKAINEKLNKMSEKEKTEWIYNFARTKKEKERIGFLNALDGGQNNQPVTYDKLWLEEWCKKLINEDIYFESSGYEVYGESYWDNDFAYDYFDIFEIGKDLAQAFQIAEDLLYHKKYKQAHDLYFFLCTTPFPAYDRDMEEWVELELEEIVDENLVEVNLRQIALHLIYAQYHVAEGTERAARLFGYVSWNMCKNIKIEEFFTVGPKKLKGLDEFMQEWHAFLKNNDGDLAANLLIEASMYIGGISQLCETAREVYTRHPILYKYACEYLLNENQETECERLGLEAMHALPENLLIRGEIADFTAKAAAILNHPDMIAKSYETAFHSKSTLNNFLQLFELDDYPNITDKAAKHAQMLPENSHLPFQSISKQQMVNDLSLEHKNIIHFFNGEFDKIFEKGKKDSARLGWSSSFIGVIVPLFILMLNKNNEITLVGKELIDLIIHRINYEGGDTSNFTIQFLKWKEKVVLTNEQYERYVTWLQKKVDARTEAVVGGGYRKSYYKAAALITALGEALESNGEQNGTATLVEHYKKVHSRKRAFKAEIDMLVNT